MRFDALAVVLACGLVCASVYAYPPNYSDEPPALTDNGDDDEGGGGGYAIPQFHLGYSELTHQHQGHGDKSSGTHTAPVKTTPTTMATTSINTALWAEAISAATTAGKPTLQPAFVYSAQVPAHIEPEANRVVNAVKLASSTVAAAVAHSPTSSSYQGGSYGNGNTYQVANFNDKVEQNGDLSKKHNVGSSTSSVAVILNGDQPEFTDALGQKVPKPQPSLQVASPIDLLNPDRYEFYTFDEHGELVKRLMTMEEIQSIVANGDGEGPTIIHHGPVEDRDPEKNVQDIVNSVQDVLNKEVESNKNTTSNILPVLDTPDVSSSWSMILPAIFGNTGSVDIFAQQKPQQIVMTPDTEILETSTKAQETTTTTKSKPAKRKPGQKRKTTTTTSTTEMTPQVIQEELDSHESVYTGMQQYQHLTANMQNYDDFSQLHMQPIYHKLPDQLQVESTTKRIFINNMEVVQKPTTDEKHLEENLAKKPSYVQHKPPHRVKTPNGGHTTTKRPHSTKQKIKRKPTTTSTLAPETSTVSDLVTTTMQPLTTSPTPTTTTTTTPTTTTTTTTTTERITTTTNDPEPVGTTPTPVINVPSSTSTAAPKKKKKKPTRQPIHSSTSLKHTTTTEKTTFATTIEPDPVITTTPTPATESPHLTSTSAPKKKKKKPTRQPIHTSTTSDINSSAKPHLTSENRKPSPKPHRPRPSHHHTATSTDLTAEGSAHQEVAHNKYQHVSLHRPRPKPHKPTTTTTPKTTSTSSPSTTVIFSPVPLGTVATPHEPTLIVEEFPGYQPQNIQTRVTTESTKLPTTTSTPANSGTAGYPIPSYGLTVEESAESNTYQYKKQSLPSLPIMKPADTKPYDQDMHTMQSFDQILQSLKQPELTDNVDLKSDETSETLIKPVMYDSAENMDQLEEMANKHMIPVGRPTIDSTTAKIPSYTQHVSDTLFTAVTYPETTADVSDESTAAAGYTAPNMLMTTLPEFSTTVDRSEELTTNLPLDTNVMEIEKTTWAPLHNITYPSEDNTETTNSAPFQKITEASFVITDITDQVAEDSTEDSIQEHTEETTFESTNTTNFQETTVLPHMEQDSLYDQEPQTVMQGVTSKTPISQPQTTYGEKDSLYVQEPQTMVNGVTSETPISQPPLTYSEQDSFYVHEPQTVMHEITSETYISEPAVVNVEKDSTKIQESQTILYDKTSETPVRHPAIAYGETTTKFDEMSEDTTLLGQYRLPVAAPQKEHSAMDDDNETDNQTILVADLKPQLNLEVIKPSSQISMSDFQTQAATVASTLVDGTNTVSVDYNMMSSNETKDEIAFLMSDVIKQMSNNDQTLTNPDKTTYPNDLHYSSTHQSVPMPIRENYNDNQYTNGGHGSIRDQENINHNRYSNVATLNASFLLPSHDEVMQPSLLDSYTKDEISTDEVVEEKPNYERLENDLATDVASESSSDVANMQDESTTEINGEKTGTSAQIDYTTKLPDTMTSGYGLKPSNELLPIEDTTTITTKREEEVPSSEESTTYLPHINNEDKDQSPDTVTEDGDDRTEENISAASSEEEETTTSQIVIRNEDNDETTTFEVPLPSLSQIYAQQQELEGIDDREALFEADSSVDTTTQISKFSEETTDTQWQASSEENQSTEIEQPATHIATTQNYVTEPSTAASNGYETYGTPTTDKDHTEDVDEATTALAQSSEEEISFMETATIKVESTEGQDEIKTMDYVNEANTVHSTKDEEMAITTTEQSYSIEDEFVTNDTNMEHIDESVDGSTTLKDEENSKLTDTTEMDEITIQEITTQLPLSAEEIAEKKDEKPVTEKEDMATTTLNYEMSEETSEELSAMISEEDETDELVDEDPYIKLGETTTAKAGESSTIKPILSSISDIQSTGIETQTNYQINKLTAFTESTSSNAEYEESAKPSLDPTMKEESLYDNPQASTEDDGYMLPPPKPINAVVVNDIPTGSHPVTQADNDEQMFEGADEEDEDDQIGYQAPNLPTTSSTSTATSTTVTTTTQKPTVSTTRRLSTLKPVSYFNKQPAYALYQEPVEPLYNKQPPNPLQQQPENVQNKVITYSSVAPQQRPMQRPPQLSNLMIGSTQATRPPVKLEPSPNNSKGLEASLVNLDEDILSFARLCNELAFSYWKSITSEKISSARSLVISPFALTSMLSMVFLGARGSTSGEMNDILKLDDMVTFNPHVVFKNITDSVEKAMDSDIATTAFVREVFSDRANGKILQFFKEKTQQLYAGHVEEVNFHVVNDIIRRRTNLLVKRHTMGKVLEYLRTNSVWVNGPLATISANLFQTDCSHGSTQDRDGELFFQVHPTVRQRRLVPIPAVLFKSGFTAGYDPNLEATVVAFGRIQDTVSMIYVMPGHQSSISPSDNLDRLEKELMETAISKNAWSNLLTSLMDRPGMEVQLPRFSHRSFVNATLGLQKMGLKGLFKSDYADLGGLTGSSNRDIYLSDMIQINTFSTCGEEKIADHHHVEMYPAPPLRKRNKDVDAREDDDFDSSEAVIDFGSLVQDSALGRGFYDDLLDPKYLELPLPLRPRQARVPDAPRLRFDKPFLYFVRHNPTGMILFMGRFNPRLLP